MSELDHYLNKWRLSAPEKIGHQSDVSRVYMVRTTDGENAVLKMPQGKGVEGERMGAATLKFYNGIGAVKCLHDDDHIQLLDFIDGRMLRNLVDDGRDDEATHIICEVVKKLHAPRDIEIPRVKTLREYFKDLFELVDQGVEDMHYCWAAELANQLLLSSENERLLHGDIHHENIMHSSNDGWLAIDPKGIYGDPHYDLANCFNNPVECNGLVKSPDRINRMADIFSEELGYNRTRLLQFACVYMALSASWHLSNEEFDRAKDSLENSKIVKGVLGA